MQHWTLPEILQNSGKRKHKTHGNQTEPNYLSFEMIPGLEKESDLPAVERPQVSRL